MPESKSKPYPPFTVQNTAPEWIMLDHQLAYSFIKFWRAELRRSIEQMKAPVVRAISQQQEAALTVALASMNELHKFDDDFDSDLPPRFLEVQNIPAKRIG